MGIDFNLGFNWGPYTKARTTLAAGDSWMVPVGVWVTEYWGQHANIRLEAYSGIAWVPIQEGDITKAFQVSIMSDGTNVRVFNSPGVGDMEFWLFGVVRLMV